MIPAEKLLPDAGILQKLKDYDEAAPEAIMSMAEVIASGRHLHETQRVHSKILGVDLKAGIRSLFSTSTDVPSFKKLQAANESESVNSDWAVVGNDIRTAILRYMEERDLTARDLGFTVKEIDSLRPLNIPEWNHPRIN